MNSLARTILIFIEAVKAFFLITFRFILWCFSNQFTTIVLMLILLAMTSWTAGFLLYIKGIDQTRQELIADSPGFSEKTDAIVVLTGGSERIKHAIFLLDLGMAKKLFISGVNREVTLNDLLALHGYPKEQRAAIKRNIDIGYQAEDTIDNASEIAEWVNENHFTSIRLVTSNYHMKRAMLELQHTLPQTRIIPHGVVPLNIRIDKWWDFPPTRDLLVHEYNKYLAANLRIFLENFNIKGKVQYNQ